MGCHSGTFSNALSLWERVGERVLRIAAITSFAPLPRPFSQREKGETTKNN
jgi:hypothetical protein